MHRRRYRGATWSAYAGPYGAYALVRPPDGPAYSQVTNASSALDSRRAHDHQMRRVCAPARRASRGAYALTTGARDSRLDPRGVTGPAAQSWGGNSLVDGCAGVATGAAPLLLDPRSSLRSVDRRTSAAPIRLVAS